MGLVAIGCIIRQMKVGHNLWMTQYFQNDAGAPEPRLNRIRKMLEGTSLASSMAPAHLSPPHQMTTDSNNNMVMLTPTCNNSDQHYLPPQLMTITTQSVLPTSPSAVDGPMHDLGHPSPSIDDSNTMEWKSGLSRALEPHVWKIWWGLAYLENWSKMTSLLMVNVPVPSLELLMGLRVSTSGLYLSQLYVEEFKHQTEVSTFPTLFPIFIFLLAEDWWRKLV